MFRPLYILILLSPPLVIAHDPLHKICDLLSLPLPSTCTSNPDCQSTYDSKCQDDKCACSYTAQAESCVHCIATDESVNKYNDYLGACVSLGLSNPSTTHIVQDTPSDQDTTSQNVRFTDQVVETQVGTQPNLEYPSTPIQSSFVVTTPYRGVAKGVSQGQGQAGSTDIPQPLNVAAGPASSGNSYNYGLSNPTDINAIQTSGISLQTPPSQDASTSALNSSRNFFSQAISERCAGKCALWKNQSDMCSHDRCLCSENVLLTAPVCSDCVVSDKSKESTAGRCYSEFDDACKIATGAVGNTTTPVDQGALTDQLSPSVNPQDQQGSPDQGGVPYGYGTTNAIPLQGSNPTGQIQPMLVSDASNNIYTTMMSNLTTQYVTATAGALIAEETIVVDSGSGRVVVSGGRAAVGSLIALGLVMVMR